LALSFWNTGRQAAICPSTTPLYSKICNDQTLSFPYRTITTLEGWTRALDLRDQETKGTPSEVVEMTVRLAQLMGIADKDLIHIRRGALLHDIGKMAFRFHFAKPDR
jgi:HD-GYP domain-containing protein (c-di-GMP phosphodiesterase class II)